MGSAHAPMPSAKTKNTARHFTCNLTRRLYRTQVSWLPANNRSLRYAYRFFFMISQHDLTNPIGRDDPVTLRRTPYAGRPVPNLASVRASHRSEEHTSELQSLRH